MSDLFVGVDIGGTKIATAVVDDQGRILGSTTVPSQGSDESVLDRIWSAIDQGVAAAKLSWAQVVGVGIGAPGAVDPDLGKWWGSTNFSVPNPPISLRQEIEARSGRPVFIDNDVKAGGLGEYHFGCGREVSDAEGGLLFISVGTGMAGALLVGGRLFRGERDAGEIGHIPFDLEGHPCACGQWGCLETFASGRALTRWGRAALEAGWSKRLLESCGGDPARLKGGDIFTAAMEGEPVAQGLIERLARGIALAALVGFRVYDPRLVVLGGGVIAGGGSYLMERIRRAYHGLSPTYDKREQIYATRLGTQAGVLGAAAVALNGIK